MKEDSTLHPSNILHFSRNLSSRNRMVTARTKQKTLTAKSRNLSGQISIEVEIKLHREKYPDSRNIQINFP